MEDKNENIEETSEECSASACHCTEDKNEKEEDSEECSCDDSLCSEKTDAGNSTEDKNEEEE